MRIVYVYFLNDIYCVGIKKPNERRVGSVRRGMPSFLGGVIEQFAKHCVDLVRLISDIFIRVLAKLHAGIPKESRDIVNHYRLYKIEIAYILKKRLYLGNMCSTLSRLMPSRKMPSGMEIPRCILHASSKSLLKFCSVGVQLSIEIFIQKYIHRLHTEKRSLSTLRSLSLTLPFIGLGSSSSE